jgi:hypothetical protein
MVGVKVDLAKNSSHLSKEEVAKLQEQIQEKANLVFLFPTTPARSIRKHFDDFG